MKKSILLILIMFLLSACTTSPIDSSENTMTLNITNNGDFDFYSIGISTGKHTGGISNADGSKFEKGATIIQQYIEGEDFDLQGVETFEFMLYGKGEKEIPLKEITLDLAANKEYFFEITGDSITQADLKRIQ